MRTLLKIAELAVDAVSDENRWFDISDALADSFGMRSTAIYRSPLPGQPVSSPYYSRLLFTPEASRLMTHFKSGGDETDQAVYHMLLAAPPLQLMTELSFFGVPNENCLPFCTERQILREDLGVNSRLAAVLNDAGPWRDVVTMQAQQSPLDVPASVFREVDMLLPILSKSMATFRAFEVLKRQFGAALGALEMLNFGAALVDPSGRLLYENAYFQEVLANGDGIGRYRDGRLLIRSRSATRLFALALNSACHRNSISPDPMPEQISVPKRSGGEPFFMKLHAVRDRLGETDIAGEFALLFLIDPTRAGSLSDAGILQMKLLTRAEEQVCRLLLSGSTTRDISAKRETSLETARAQVKAVLSKLRCRNRLHLYQTAFTTHLPIRNKASCSTGISESKDRS